jgi:hypothetical protein
VLAGLQKTTYPISYVEQKMVLKQYLNLLFEDDYKKKVEKYVPNERVYPSDFIGPSLVTLEVQNIAVTFNNGNYAAQTRMISLALRNGVPVQYIAEQLGRDENSDMFSFHKVMARVLKKYVADGTESSEYCEMCHEKLRFEGGCSICPSCSFSPKCS